MKTMNGYNSCSYIDPCGLDNCHECNAAVENRPSPSLSAMPDPGVSNHPCKWESLRFRPDGLASSLGAVESRGWRSFESSNGLKDLGCPSGMQPRQRCDSGVSGGYSGDIISDANLRGFWDETGEGRVGSSARCATIRRAIEVKQKRRKGIKLAKTIRQGLGEPSSVHNHPRSSALDPTDDENIKEPTFSDIGLKKGEVPWGSEEVEKWVEAKKAYRAAMEEGKSFDLEFLFDETPDLTRPNRSDNKFSSLSPEEPLTSCKFSSKLRKKADFLIRFFGRELGLSWVKKADPIECGGLRAAVRKAFFGHDLTVVQELSLKTAQKAEDSCCKQCEPRFLEKVGNWKRRMAEPVEVDAEHLKAYKRAFRANVPAGWNRTKVPFVPNGSSARMHGCASGGNWNEEPFSDEAYPVLVFSSGKPRIVTCFSSFNSETLHHLHTSLYSVLSRRGWLLKGDPTSEHVDSLNGLGPYLSFDYVGATDNIKVEYVRAGIEVLVEMAEGLTDDERRCMEVIGCLRLGFRCPLMAPQEGDPDFGPTEGFFRGQPMGSLLSFPLLCLTNKTIVDMSLTDLLERKEIGFNEWTQHRSLINGDDLLVREPTATSDLSSRIIYNGGQVGMETNTDKCLRSDHLAEINSTLFDYCKHVKKTNGKALYMKTDVEDVLGLAYEATVTRKGFVTCVRANLGLLKKQEDKFVWKLPFPYQRFCRQDKKINRALRFVPLSKKLSLENAFPVVPKPDGYDLFPSEERAIIEQRVRDVRPAVLYLYDDKIKTEREIRNWNKERKELGLPTFKKDEKIKTAYRQCSWRRLVKRKKNTKENVLKVLADYYQNEVASLGSEDVDWDPINFEHGPASGPCSRPSRIQQLSDTISPPKLCAKTPVPLVFNFTVDTAISRIFGAWAYPREFEYLPREKKRRPQNKGN